MAAPSQEPSRFARIRKLKEAHIISEAVVVRLRRLQPEDLQAILGEGDDFEWRLDEMPDKDQFIMSLIAQQTGEPEVPVPRAAQPRATTPRPAAAPAPPRAPPRAAPPQAALAKAVTPRPARTPLNEAPGKASPAKAGIFRLAAGPTLARALPEAAPPHAVPAMAPRAKAKALSKVWTQTATQLEDSPAQGHNYDDDVEAALIQEVEHRIEANRKPWTTLAITRLRSSYGLDDTVELALSLLTPELLREVLAANRDIQEKMAAGRDANELMMWLVSQLDPEVGGMVTKLSEIDSLAPCSDSTESAVETVMVDETGEDPLEETSGQEVYEVEGADMDAEAISEAAEARLRAHSGARRDAQIAELFGGVAFEDEVVLALRMLAPEVMDELLAGKLELRRKLSERADKNGLVLALISDLDPEVGHLVQRLAELDEERAPAAAAELAQAAAPAPLRLQPRGTILADLAPPTVARVSVLGRQGQGPVPGPGMLGLVRPAVPWQAPRAQQAQRARAQRAQEDRSRTPAPR